MAIPTEQKIVVLGGGAKTILLNGDYTYTQVTIDERNTGIVTGTVRALRENNDLAQFKPNDFEQITDGAVNLATVPRKLTYSINNKRVSALHLEDSAPGIDYTVFIRQWNRASS